LSVVPGVVCGLATHFFPPNSAVDTEPQVSLALTATLLGNPARGCVWCGLQFTNKLEGMFKDIDLSRDCMTSFRQSKQSAQLLAGIEMNIHVLTQGYWPTYPPQEVVLPPEISTYQVRSH
jgi:hypothetical protein